MAHKTTHHHKMTKQEALAEAERLLEVARTESLNSPLLRHRKSARVTPFDNVLLPFRVLYNWFRHDVLGSDERGPVEKLFWILVVFVVLSGLAWLIGVTLGLMFRPLVSG